jgi:nitrogen fixation-related uncharacterized protein
MAIFAGIAVAIAVVIGGAVWWSNYQEEQAQLTGYQVYERR